MCLWRAFESQGHGDIHINKTNGETGGDVQHRHERKNRIALGASALRFHRPLLHSLFVCVAATTQGEAISLHGQDAD